MEYFITPRIPGIRPADPPDYDGITFVYVFTQVLDPWVQPPVHQNVTLVVANCQGFVAGMTVVVENGGYYQVVSTTALDRMTVQNFGTNYNVIPGTGIAPGKVIRYRFRDLQILFQDLQEARSARTTRHN
jgi:hypothetical protein